MIQPVRRKEKKRILREVIYTFFERPLVLWEPEKGILSLTIKVGLR